MAKQITTERTPAGLRIIYSWKSAARWFLLFFALLWNGMVFFFFTVGAGWFIVFHLLAGLAILYYTLCLFVNRSTIEIGQGRLRVGAGPLPNLASRTDLAVRSIQQLYLQRTGEQKSGNKTTPLYSLVARLDTGAEKKLVNSIANPDVVRELESTIEDFLGIQDEAVALPDEPFAGYRQVRDMLPDKWGRHLDRMEAQHRERVDAERNAGKPGYKSKAPLPRPRQEQHLPAAPLPQHDSPGDFPLYRAESGAEFLLQGRPATVGRSAQLDWDDARIPHGRQIEVRTADGETTYFYAALEHERWSYHEERRLGQDELRRLGFTATAAHPSSLSNGGDRYYPHERQHGHRFAAGAPPREVEQYVYFTTRASTEFRALRPLGGDWEVYVMEPVSGSRYANKSS